MDALADDSGARVADLDLPTPDKGSAAHPAGETMLVPATTPAASFASQVARTPDAAATVYDGTTTLTYGTSAALVGALPGVLKSGATYPVERLASMLADSGATTVVTTQRDTVRLPAVDGLGVLHVTTTGTTDATDLAETERTAADHAPAGPSAGLLDPARPDGPAYLIYTSGSTGRRGVVVAHRAIGNRLAWAQGAYGITADGQVLQKPPAGFDVGAWERLIAYLLYDGASGTTVPIGRPVWNTGVRPVPDGVPGELYLTGVQPARYHPRPALTADRFVADPYASVPGARMYRTGDLVRRRADGTLDYLYRTDQQAKLRGNRIEPGEIEAALTRHPAVARGAVAVRDGRLVTYTVPAAGAAADPADPADLAAALAGALHAPLVPEAYVVLDDLPLTPIGIEDAGVVRHLGVPGERCPCAPRRRGPRRCPRQAGRRRSSSARMVATAKEPRCRPARQTLPGRWPCALTGPGPHASGDRPAGRRARPGPADATPPGAGVLVAAAGPRALAPLGRTARRPYLAGPSTISSSARR